jgi:hypothetical protein
MCGSMSNESYQGRINNSFAIPEVPAKIYLASILGRENQATEWTSIEARNEAGLWVREALVSDPNTQPYVGIVFPHVTRIFQWGNTDLAEKATNLKQVDTLKTLEPVRGFETVSDTFCDVDLQILTGEMTIRREVDTLEEYLQRFVSNVTFMPFRNPENLL